jgi:hypothetical protein
VGVGVVSGATGASELEVIKVEGGSGGSFEIEGEGVVV